MQYGYSKQYADEGGGWHEHQINMPCGGTTGVCDHEPFRPDLHLGCATILRPHGDLRHLIVFIPQIDDRWDYDHHLLEWMIMFV